MSDNYSRPRPEWVKFNFHDLTASLKWRRMTLDQRGAYITLLAEQALFDRLPVHPEDLATVLGSSGANITPEAADGCWHGALMECFEERDGRLVNPRMAAELAEFEEGCTRLSRVRAEAGRAGGKQTQANRKQTEASPSKTKLEGERDRELESASSKQRTREDALALALSDLEPPAWVEPLMREYEQHRRDLKAKKLTKRGWLQKVRDAVKHGEAPVSAAVALSVSNGWTGLFPEKCADSASQAPSAGRWYKGPAPKQAEVSLIEDEIRVRMAQLPEVADFMLPSDEAQDMAREKGDHQRLMLDWKLGLRDSAPEKA